MEGWRLCSRLAGTVEAEGFAAGWRPRRREVVAPSVGHSLVLGDNHSQRPLELKTVLGWVL